MSQRSSRDIFLAERENGFDLDFGVRSKLPEYTALHDHNMKHYFENPTVHKLLLKTGQIDHVGKPIDLDGKNKSKLIIIENEFKRAEKKEYDYQKTELDLRNRIRVQKMNQLQSSMRLERVQWIKEDKKIQMEIKDATKEALQLISNMNADAMDDDDQQLAIFRKEP